MFFWGTVLSTPFCSMAQEEEEGNINSPASFHLRLGVAGRYYSTMDKFLSSNVYAGEAVSFHLGYLRQKNNSIGELDMSFGMGGIRPGIHQVLSSKAKLRAADINYRKVYQVRKILKNKYDWFLGGGFLTHALYREYEKFVNNTWQYDYTNSLSVESLIKRNMLVKDRSFSLDWRFSLIAASLSVRPSYNSSLPIGFIKYPDKPVKAVLKSMNFVTFNRYLRTISGLGFTYKLLNGNAIRLDYTWDFYHYFGSNSVTVATHQVNFLLLFSLTKPS